MIVRLLILPLVLAGMVRSQQAQAQGGFPAPLPNQAQTSDPAFSTSKDVGSGSIGFFNSPFSSSGAPATAPSDDCGAELVPLREEAERRSRLIKAASDRHAPPDEACRLIGSFEQAEAKMVKYVETHAQACGISVQVSDQLKGGHENTKHLLEKVCTDADPAHRALPKGPTGDFD